MRLKCTTDKTIYMKMVRIFLFIICCALSTSAQNDLSLAPGKTVTNTYALVVGISGYQDAAIPKLNYADKDARLFAQWLQSRGGGSVPGYNIQMLTNEKASIAAVYNALDWLQRKAASGDTVFIYFSGHGDIETKDNNSQGYLLAWNSPSNNYRNNAISVADLNNMANSLTTSNRATVVIITDACHSGKMAGDFYKGRELTASNLRLVLNNQVRMASCQADELAAEGPNWGGGRGVFSYYLLMGLNGKAGSNGRVKLSDLQVFLTTAFAADKFLKIENHQQHPVSDGNPTFTIAQIDSATIQALFAEENAGATAEPGAAAGLQSLKTIGKQPIDYFFEMAMQQDFDTSLSFAQYQHDSSAELPMRIVKAYIEKLKNPLALIDQKYFADSVKYISNHKKYIDELKKRTDLSDSDKTTALLFLEDVFEVQQKKDQEENVQAHVLYNQLSKLSDQLQKNSFSNNNFVQRFVQLIHNRSQEMINAYLRGDLAELEKRQYYATGNRNYRDFLPLLKIAVNIAPENNYLKNILRINEAYLTGLIDRLDIMTNALSADSLLQTASKKIKVALKLEPYSAYIHNEMGNIYFQQKKYDSSLYHFDYAAMLAPAWAIPHSNTMRVNLAKNNLPAAISAANTANKLQPNLAFVNTNAGLVMEKDGNLLAAESYYLQSIQENNVHYLPYERLGQLYLRTGEYAKADSFLYESNRRKELFAVNEAVFEYGIEQGGDEALKNGDAFVNFCTGKNDSLLTDRNKYEQILGAIGKLQSGKDSAKLEGKILAKKVLEQWPDAVLLHHYLGKQLYYEGNFSAAENVLKKAILNYKTGKDLKNYLKKVFTDSLSKNSLLQKKLKLDIDSSCILQIFIYLQYGGLEDHYMLAGIYEKNNQIAEALKEYAIISGIENNKQQEQAAAKDIYQPVRDPLENEIKFNKYLYDNDLDHAKYLYKYNHPVLKGGTLKTARLLEKKGKFTDAEQTYLNQVAQNQAAGFLRQKKMNEANSYDSLNKYWLQINEDLESETFHFYKRMISLFPRDDYWYKNAGLFLYKRLLMTYSQVLPEERVAFYIYAKEHAYPFKTSIEGQNEVVGSEGFAAADKKYFLPGTREEIKLDTNRYEPLTEASYFLQQAIKFSGDQLPSPVFTEYVADLQSWMGKFDSASINYRYLVKTFPANVALRNKLINVLRINKQFPDVAENLEVLYKHNKLAALQVAELAEYKMLQKKYPSADRLLQSFLPESNEEKIHKSFLYMKMYLLRKDYTKGFTEAKKGLLLGKDDEEKYLVFLYTTARIYALNNQQVQAIQTLKKLFSKNFKLYYLLRNDAAWDKIKNSADWKKLANTESADNIYSNSENSTGKKKYDVVNKRIPELK